MSPQSSFEFIDRGRADSLLLIPGWATDGRIFAALELDYNYVLCTALNPVDFDARALRALQLHRVDRVAVFGWSMGGYIGNGFAARHPGLVSRVYLCGIRERYDTPTLAGVRAKLEKDRRAFLAGFYRSCFSKGDERGYAQFRRTLLSDYLQIMTLPELCAGLDYLEQAVISAGCEGGKTTIVHGGADAIAPVEEARAVAARIGARFVELPDRGHLPFFDPDFAARLEAS